MIDFISILNSDAKKQIIDSAAEIAGTDKTCFDELMRISLYENYPLNMRAIRVVEICTLKKHDLFLPYLTKSVMSFPEMKIGGLKRIFPKIFTLFVDKMTEEEISVLIDTCFKQILDKNEEPAVRANSMTLMAKTAEIIPEIKIELQSVLEYIIDESPASIKARANNILKKLNKQCD